MENKDLVTAREVISRNVATAVTLPYLPGELVEMIATFSGFREVYFLHFSVPEVCPERYLREYGAKTVEEAIQEGRMYEVNYYFLNNRWSRFRRMILLSRAIHLEQWPLVRFLSFRHQIPPWTWDLLRAVRMGTDERTLKTLLEQYPEIELEKLRPLCLYEAEQNMNVRVFGYLIRECEIQRRWRGRIRKLIQSIEKGKDISALCY
jgi:hypothetical protein